jgi:hypothetical protein
MPHSRPLIAGLLAALAALAPAPPQASPADARDPQIGQAFRVPYKRTLTNHYLVRCRINGKGPFNFLVDTGAPALFIGTEAGKAVGLAPDDKAFWTPVDRFQIEGGIDLRNVKARVEDPFQLEGMNALGLPGAKIHGILGFTILARFRMEFDPTDDRMTWTRLDYEPKDPYVPSDPAERQAPADVQAMNLLGPAMKLMSVFVGKQPEDIRLPQGILGIEIAEDDGRLIVSGVLPETPAAAADIRPGDLIVSIADAPTSTAAQAHDAITRLRPGETINLTLRRGDQTLTHPLKAAAGF